MRLYRCAYADVEEEEAGDRACDVVENSLSQQRPPWDVSRRGRAGGRKG